MTERDEDATHVGSITSAAVQEFVDRAFHRPEAMRRLRERSQAPELRDVRPDPAIDAARVRIGEQQAAVDRLTVERVDDFRGLAASLTDLAKVVRDVVVPQVTRAHERLRTGPFESNTSYFGADRVGHVPDLVRRSRDAHRVVTASLENVARSLEATARAVEQVRRSFADVREMNADRLTSMNRQFETHLRGPGQRSTSGTPSV